jgi:hypothetical protein
MLEAVSHPMSTPSLRTHLFWPPWFPGQWPRALHLQAPP